jgi:hypothetical protein
MVLQPSGNFSVILCNKSINLVIIPFLHLTDSYCFKLIICANIANVFTDLVGAIIIVLSCCVIECRK